MIKQYLLKILNAITSTRAAGMYFLLFAFTIGAATFVENDFGTSSAQEVIFKSTWFEMLLGLFGITILTNIWRFKLIKQKKWASLLFHSSVVIIILGAAHTRYYGTEGMMHIREGETGDKYLSAESFLKFQVLKNEKSYSFDEPTHLSSLGNNDFESSYQIGNSMIDVSLDKFVPNPVEKVSADPKGLPMIKVVIGSADGREEYYVKQGDKASINGVNFNFTAEQIPDAFNVILEGDALSFFTDTPMNQRVMATQKIDDLPASTKHTLMLRSLYTTPSGASFVVGEFIPSGILTSESGNRKIKNESKVALHLKVAVNGKPQQTIVTGSKGEEGQAQILDFGDTKIAVSYGSKLENLPFSLMCKDFILEKYPGTENPSSYASEVKLIDPNNSVNRDQRIFMNNILEYGGYRFFQSSFDQDELGTYLSVNHDYWGSLISYIGYAMLTLGLILTFFDKKSRFSTLIKKLDEFQVLAKSIILILLFAGMNSVAIAQENQLISKEHAEKFGKILVQDQNGRIKPMNTFSNEVLRKIAKKESLFDKNADQLILLMMINPEGWSSAKMIQVPAHDQIKKILNTEEKLLSYSSFFGSDGSYIFKDQMQAAQAMIPKDQGTFEKALIKLDEKINIINMVFSGSLFRLFPVQNDATNKWIAPAEVLHEHQSAANNDEAKTLFLNYIQALNDGIGSNNYSNADLALTQISNYQRKYGMAVIPSDTKLGAEVWLNKLDVFNRLKNYYGILCILFTGMFLYGTIKRKDKIPVWTKYAFYAMAFGFIFHTIGLGLRWYVSGRAPWSNGYESMIYIAWTTMLAGTLFSRRSFGGLAATATLAATILLVASMSWLDPEITPLVPVLKSYWLTIHVSLEAGSYGFLMLGAVIGMLNLVLMVFMNEKNKTNITRAIKELTIISEITLIGGLVMVSIGTYLGGVWANESWGRYWGWDAKETWALVTILVYAFILHMRFIPKIQSVFAFNFASLFGFATVLMTYLGVNYYLSGLHSYAAGDPVPMPAEVYYTAFALSALSLAAFLKYKKYMVGTK
jgi:cytochrome c-type biogenesis protein CcsB